VLIGACKKKEIYPEIPSIEFKSYYFTTDPITPTDTLLGVIFSYKDGDGDIGLNPEDTFPPYDSHRGANDKELNPYYYNLNIDYLVLGTNGTFVPVIKPNTTDTLRFQARVQNITPEGRHKAIRGDIDWQILPPPYENLPRVIKLKVKIYDRALHESNTIESPVITLP
jgi:hypothetical protein